MSDARDGDGSVRGARDAEHAAIRRLMPSVFTATSAPDRLFVATAGSGEIVAAAGIEWRLGGQPPGFRVHIEVAEHARRRHLGSALLSAAVEAARGEVKCIHPWVALDEGGAAHAFVAARGFELIRRILHFDVDGATFHRMIASIRDRLRVQARIPAAASTVPLAAVDPVAVARLLCDVFGTRYDTALANVTGWEGQGYDRARSVVLLHGDEVGGALLFRWNAGVPDIDVNLVRPQWRGRWANVLLLEHATRNGLAGGATRFTFRCDERVRDSVNLARRAGADLLKREVEYVLRVVDAARA